MSVSARDSEKGQKRKLTVSRRAVVCMAVSCGLGLLELPSLAFADDLSDAKAKYNEAKGKLDELATEFEKLSKAQSDTQGKIYDLQKQIDATEADIEDTQTRIDDTTEKLNENRQRLEKRVRADYKAGGGHLAEVLLNATSFDELINNLYYTDKINRSDAELIDSIVQDKTELERDKTELEAKRTDLTTQKSKLDELNESQLQSLKEMQDKQAETQQMLDKLDSKVKELIKKQQDDMLAAAAERDRQKKASAQAGGNTGTLSKTVIGSGSQARVVNNCWSVPSPGPGLCAMWVSQVYSASGLGYPGGNACDMYNQWCVSSNLSELKPGMIVAVSSHAHTTAGRIYGHIGIYVGNGTIRDNVGYVRTIGLNEWINYYSTTVTVRWGWIWGKALS